MVEATLSKRTRPQVPQVEEQPEIGEFVNKITQTHKKALGAEKVDKQLSNETRSPGSTPRLEGETFEVQIRHFQGTLFTFELRQENGRWAGKIKIQNWYDHSKSQMWVDSDEARDSKHPNYRPADTHLEIDVGNNLDLSFEEQTKIIETFIAKINTGRQRANKESLGFIHGANTMRDILMPLETSGNEVGILALDRDFDFQKDAEGLKDVTKELLKNNKLRLGEIDPVDGIRKNPFMKSVEEKIAQLNKDSDGTYRFEVQYGRDPSGMWPFGRFNNSLAAQVVTAAYADFDFTVKKIACKDGVPLKAIDPDEKIKLDRENERREKRGEVLIPDTEAMTEILCAGYNRWSYYLDDDGHVGLLYADKQLRDNTIVDPISQQKLPLIRVALGGFEHPFKYIAHEYFTVLDKIANDQNVMDKAILDMLRADNPGKDVDRLFQELKERDIEDKQRIAEEIRKAKSDMIKELKEYIQKLTNVKTTSDIDQYYDDYLDYQAHRLNLKGRGLKDDSITTQLKSTFGEEQYSFFEKIRKFHAELKVDYPKRDGCMLNVRTMLMENSLYQKAINMMLTAHSGVFASLAKQTASERPEQGQSKPIIIHIANTIFHRAIHPRLNAAGKLTMENVEIRGGFIGFTDVAVMEWQEVVFGAAERWNPSRKDLNNPNKLVASFVHPSLNHPPDHFETANENDSRADRPVNNPKFVDSRRLRLFINGAANLKILNSKIERGVELYGNIEKGEVDQYSTFRANCMGIEKLGLKFHHPNYFGGLYLWLATYGLKINSAAAKNLSDENLKSVLSDASTWPLFGGTWEEFKNRYYRQEMIDMHELMFFIKLHQQIAGYGNAQIVTMNADKATYVPYGREAYLRLQGQAAGKGFMNKQFEFTANITQIEKNRRYRWDGEPLTIRGWRPPGVVQSAFDVARTSYDALFQPRNLMLGGRMIVRDPETLGLEYDSKERLPIDVSPGRLYSTALGYMGSTWQSEMKLPAKGRGTRPEPAPAPDGPLPLAPENITPEELSAMEASTIGKTPQPEDAYAELHNVPHGVTVGSKKKPSKKEDDEEVLAA